MTVYELKTIAILNIKGVDFRHILWGFSRDEAANRLNKSVLGCFINERKLLLK